MIESVHVFGARGRVGSAVAARLAERGSRCARDGADLVLLCVPDGAIAEVAAAVEPGPWIAHVERRHAARRARAAHAALRPPPAADVRPRPRPRAARRRVARHGGDGRGARGGTELAGLSACEPFDTGGREPRRSTTPGPRSPRHGSSRSTHRRRAVRRRPGAPPEALVPLMRRTIENGFELTGPVARGDRGTVEAHLAAIRAARPEPEPLYRDLAEATAASR